MKRLFHGFDVAKTFGHVQNFSKWRGQISKWRGQNLAIDQDFLGIVLKSTVISKNISEIKKKSPINIFLPFLLISQIVVDFTFYDMHSVWCISQIKRGCFFLVYFVFLSSNFVFHICFCVRASIFKSMRRLTKIQFRSLYSKSTGSTHLHSIPE